MTCGNILVILKARVSTNSRAEKEMEITCCSLILLFYFHSSPWTAHAREYRLCIWGRFNNKIYFILKSYEQYYFIFVEKKKYCCFFFIDGHFKHPIWRRSYKRDWHGKLPWCKSITGEKLFSKGLPVLSIHLIKESLYMVWSYVSV